VKQRPSFLKKRSKKLSSIAEGTGFEPANSALSETDKVFWFSRSPFAIRFFQKGASGLPSFPMGWRAQADALGGAAGNLPRVVSVE
jgi:hypothetical protein